MASRYIVRVRDVFQATSIFCSGFSNINNVLKRTPLPETHHSPTTMKRFLCFKVFSSKLRTTQKLHQNPGFVRLKPLSLTTYPQLLFLQPPPSCTCTSGRLFELQSDSKLVLVPQDSGVSKLCLQTIYPPHHGCHLSHLKALCKSGGTAMAFWNGSGTLRTFDFMPSFINECPGCHTTGKKTAKMRHVTRSRPGRMSEIIVVQHQKVDQGTTTSSWFQSM